MKRKIICEQKNTTNSSVMKICNVIKETLPKALRTQALTALTSNFGRFGLVGLVW